MSIRPRAAIPEILSQHLDDAIVLRGVRSVLVTSPHAKLHQLARTDERLAAHLDGLSVSGEHGVTLSTAALESPGLGQIFVSGLLALERRDAAQIERLLALVGVVPEAERALSSAFGWAAAPLLRGLTGTLLRGATPAARWLGIAACAQHRVDPGDALPAALADTDALLRRRALRAAGELGRHDLLPQVLAQADDPDPAAGLAASASAVRLGDRSQALEHLRKVAVQPGPLQAEALMLSLFTADAEAARALVRQLAPGGSPMRTLIRAAGWAGDAQVVPWLLNHMKADPKLARVAGEAFSFITGADLAYLDLDRKPPEGEVFGPNDDPAEADVAMDEDDVLPWPDADKLAAWWQMQGSRFTPGTRYFVGEPPSVAHCLSVLKNGFQRQRMAAADYLCLLAPGTALFNAAAPAWRQQRQLAQMQA